MHKGPALIQFRDESNQRPSPPVSSTHFDEHSRHPLPLIDEKLVHLSTSSSSVHHLSHVSSMPPPLFSTSSSSSRHIHPHQFGGQPPPLLPTAIRNEEHQQQSPFPRRRNRFDEREDLTQTQDNNINYSVHRGGRNYNDRANPNIISRGYNRGRGGEKFNNVSILTN